ncbi:unnamed protein product [Nezara viridula]|uniref:Uncharacterized protein n=1 Tax=Nezara viridula TaxID=85310 RepID=A0A9P0ED14_NEZVI|nr:unnamed protein product [Nezara viridula]
MLTFPIPYALHIPSRFTIHFLRPHTIILPLIEQIVSSRPFIYLHSTLPDFPTRRHLILQSCHPHVYPPPYLTSDSTCVSPPPSLSPNHSTKVRHEKLRSSLPFLSNSLNCLHPPVTSLLPFTPTPPHCSCIDECIRLLPHHLFLTAVSLSPQAQPVGQDMPHAPSASCYLLPRSQSCHFPNRRSPSSGHIFLLLFILPSSSSSTFYVTSHKKDHILITNSRPSLEESKTTTASVNSRHPSHGLQFRALLTLLTTLKRDTPYVITQSQHLHIVQAQSRNSSLSSPRTSSTTPTSTLPPIFPSPSPTPRPPMASDVQPAPLSPPLTPPPASPPRHSSPVQPLTTPNAYAPYPPSTPQPQALPHPRPSLSNSPPNNPPPRPAPIPASPISSLPPLRKFPVTHSSQDYNTKFRRTQISTTEHPTGLHKLTHDLNQTTTTPHTPPNTLRSPPLLILLVRQPQHLLLDHHTQPPPSATSSHEVPDPDVSVSVAIVNPQVFSHLTQTETTGLVLTCHYHHHTQIYPSTTISDSHTMVTGFSTPWSASQGSNQDPTHSTLHSSAIPPLHSLSTLLSLTKAADQTSPPPSPIHSPLSDPTSLGPTSNHLSNQSYILSVTPSEHDSSTSLLPSRSPRTALALPSSRFVESQPPLPNASVVVISLQAPPISAQPLNTHPHPFMLPSHGPRNTFYTYNSAPASGLSTPNSTESGSQIDRYGEDPYSFSDITYLSVLIPSLSNTLIGWVRGGGVPPRVSLPPTNLSSTRAILQKTTAYLPKISHPKLLNSPTRSPHYRYVPHSLLVNLLNTTIQVTSLVYELEENCNYQILLTHLTSLKPTKLSHHYSPPSRIILCPLLLRALPNTHSLLLHAGPHPRIPTPTATSAQTVYLISIHDVGWWGGVSATPCSPFSLAPIVAPSIPLSHPHPTPHSSYHYSSAARHLSSPLSFRVSPLPTLRTQRSLTLFSPLSHRLFRRPLPHGYASRPVGASCHSRLSPSSALRTEGIANTLPLFYHQTPRQPILSPPDVTPHSLRPPLAFLSHDPSTCCPSVNPLSRRPRITPAPSHRHPLPPSTCRHPATPTLPHHSSNTTHGKLALTPPPPVSGHTRRHLALITFSHYLVTRTDQRSAVDLTSSPSPLFIPGPARSAPPHYNLSRLTLTSHPSLQAVPATDLLAFLARSLILTTPRAIPTPSPPWYPAGLHRGLHPLHAASARRPDPLPTTLIYTLHPTLPATTTTRLASATKLDPHHPPSTPRTTHHATALFSTQHTHRKCNYDVLYSHRRRPLPAPRNTHPCTLHHPRPPPVLFTTHHSSDSGNIRSHRLALLTSTPSPSVFRPFSPLLPLFPSLRAPTLIHLPPDPFTTLFPTGLATGSASSTFLHGLSGPFLTRPSRDSRLPPRLPHTPLGSSAHTPPSLARRKTMSLHTDTSLHTPTPWNRTRTIARSAPASRNNPPDPKRSLTHPPIPAATPYHLSAVRYPSPHPPSHPRTRIPMHNGSTSFPTKRLSAHPDVLNTAPDAHSTTAQTTPPPPTPPQRCHSKTSRIRPRRTGPPRLPLPLRPASQFTLCHNPWDYRHVDLRLYVSPSLLSASSHASLLLRCTSPNDPPPLTPTHPPPSSRPQNPYALRTPDQQTLDDSHSSSVHNPHDSNDWVTTTLLLVNPPPSDSHSTPTWGAPISLKHTLLC